MRTLAFAVLSTITAMLLTLDTAEAHWRPTTQTWRCPPCIFPPPYPRRSDWPVCVWRYRWDRYWYLDCF